MVALETVEKRDRGTGCGFSGRQRQEAGSTEKLHPSRDITTISGLEPNTTGFRYGIRRLEVANSS